MNLTLLILVLSISILSACGKKGALYLPVEQNPVVVPEIPEPQINEVPAEDSPEESAESKKKPAEK